MTFDNASYEDELKHYRAQLPDFAATRAGATQALAETAQDIGLELSDADVRALALAIVDAIEKGVYLQGLDVAYGITAEEVRWFQETVITPVAAAAGTDAGAAHRLYLHQQYADGMAKVRDRLRGVLLCSFRQWLGLQQPVLQAPPVVPTPAPAAAAAARARSAIRAGVA